MMFENLLVQGLRHAGYDARVELGEEGHTRTVVVQDERCTITLVWRWKGRVVYEYHRKGWIDISVGDLSFPDAWTMFDIGLQKMRKVLN